MSVTIKTLKKVLEILEPYTDDEVNCVNAGYDVEVVIGVKNMAEIPENIKKEMEEFGFHTQQDLSRGKDCYYNWFYVDQWNES